VKATVLAGYDLDQISVDANSATMVITIGGLPRPKILSIDHDLDYYDLSEGTFNTFSTADLNSLNNKAKNFIEQTALESDLLKQAEERGQELLETIRFLVEAQGWQLKIEEGKSHGNKTD